MTSRKFLFITLSNIGDAILTIPVLRFLNRHDENASIDIVSDHRSASLFQHCPCRGDIYHKQKNRLLRGAPALLFELRRNRYDIVVDLRTDFLAYLIRAEKKFIKPAPAGHGHAVERHFSVISRLAGDAKIPAPVLWPGPVDRDYAERICRQLPGQKWLCVGPGANWSEKIWPAEKYAKLIDALAPTFDGLVLLGNEADNTQARHIARRAPLPWLNLCGQTTILEAVAVLERMTLFIGNDSALGHMASAVNTASFTLFGPGDPARYHPWGDLAGWHVDPDRNINHIPVDLVIKKVSERLHHLSRPHRRRR